MDLALQRVRTLLDELKGLPPVPRLVFLGAGVVILALLLLPVLENASGSQYEPIYTNLTPATAAQIAQALAAQKIPYQVSPDGTTVSVPQADAGQARLDVAGAGVSTDGNVGLSLFDKPLYGNSDFQNQVMFMQALEGQLARTIMAMSQVASARVSIVLPQQGLYTSQNTPASAAVFLQLKPFSYLTPEQVAGIQALVAHSVQGLTPGNVTVVDSQGNILSSSGSQTALSGPLATEQAFDQALSSSLVSLLTPIFGPGNVVARADATLNFNQETIVKDLFTAPLAKGSLVQSLQELKSSFTGTAQPPGTASNIPSYGQSGSGRSQSLQLTEKNAIDETQQTLRIAPGAVSRLTVSVVINRHLTPAEQRALTQVVANAIGYDPARHDQIIVQGLPFTNSLSNSIAAAASAEAAALNRRTLVLAGGAAAGLLLLALFGFLLLRSLRRRVEPVPPLPSEELAAAGPIVSEEDQTLEELARLVRQNPDAAAEVVRGWLREG